MKRLALWRFFLVAVTLTPLVPVSLFAQGQSANPLSGNIVAPSASCSSGAACVWQQLPNNAATTTINLSGSFSATLVVEESNNHGTTWTTANTLSTVGTTAYSTNGFTDIRVRCSAFSSGSVAVTINTGLMQLVTQGTTGTFKVPLLSNANILSISSNGSALTITCDQPGCGLSVGGPSLDLGMALPVGCADAPGDVIATSGNTATVAYSGSCTYSGPPIAGQLGQIAAAVTLQNSAGDPNHNALITQTADGHTRFAVYLNGVEASGLDLQNGGPASLRSRTFGLGFSLGPDFLACVGQPFVAMGQNCAGAGFADTGALIKYQGLAALAGHGLPFIVYGATDANSPSLSNYTIFTTPPSGYGAANLYRISFYSVETSSASGASLSYTVSYTDESGANSQSSRTLDMSSVGARAVYTTTFSAIASSTIQISTTLVSSPVFKFYVTLEAL